MAMCNRTPLSPTTNEEKAMTAGPVRKRTAIAKEATVFPQAIILGCNAMNNPTNTQQNNNNVINITIGNIKINKLMVKLNINKIYQG